MQHDCLKEVLTATEASKLWGLDDSTIKRACNQGRFHKDECRRAGGTWLIKREAVERIYGQQPQGDEQSD